MRVLVIEDEQRLAGTLADMIDDMGYDADYQWSDTGDWSMADDAQIVSEDAAVPEENGEIAEDPGTYEGAEATFEDYAAVGEY